MKDTDSDSSKDFVLDVSLFVLDGEWGSENGGSVVYAAKDQEEPLMSIFPSSNCLALVYRDRETLRCTKYLNVRAGKSEYYEIYSIFREINNGSP